jgi:hypothetical protein
LILGHPYLSELETLSSIEHRHRTVHRVILCSRSPFFARLFERRSVPTGHIALIVLDSQIIPAHLLRVVLMFIYTSELIDLETQEAQKVCELASDHELSGNCQNFFAF